mmetsp:Transcript_41359/g.127845  ORF Transcript_41359/g.127845 Transcript_41359/m.127845 type:complete len:357 (-) Transcript_41359:250-1320(-)
MAPLPKCAQKTPKSSDHDMGSGIRSKSIPRRRAAASTTSTVAASLAVSRKSSRSSTAVRSGTAGCCAFGLSLKAAVRASTVRSVSRTMAATSSQRSARIVMWMRPSPGATPNVGSPTLKCVIVLSDPADSGSSQPTVPSCNTAFATTDAGETPCSGVAACAVRPASVISTPVDALAKVPTRVRTAPSGRPGTLWYEIGVTSFTRANARRKRSSATTRRAPRPVSSAGCSTKATAAGPSCGSSSSDDGASAAAAAAAARRRKAAIIDAWWPSWPHFMLTPGTRERCACGTAAAAAGSATSSIGRPSSSARNSTTRRPASSSPAAVAASTSSSVSFSTAFAAPLAAASSTPAPPSRST